MLLRCFPWLGRAKPTTAAFDLDFIGKHHPVIGNTSLHPNIYSSPVVIVSAAECNVKIERRWKGGEGGKQRGGERSWKRQTQRKSGTLCQLFGKHLGKRWTLLKIRFIKVKSALDDVWPQFVQMGNLGGTSCSKWIQTFPAAALTTFWH